MFCLLFLLFPFKFFHENKECQSSESVPLVPGVRKVAVMEVVACRRHLPRKSKAQILAVWFQTDLQPVKQNLCLAPDQKMVRPKKVANDLKINLAQ